MSRQQQMVVASVVFGVTVALVTMYWRDALVPVAMIGGAAVGLGWAFYAKKE